MSITTNFLHVNQEGTMMAQSFLKFLLVSLFSLFIIIFSISSVNAGCAIEATATLQYKILDYNVGQSFTATCDGQLYSIMVRKMNSPVTGATLAIYNGQSLDGGDLIHSQNNVTIADNVPIELSGSVNLVSGQKYTFYFSGGSNGYSIYYSNTSAYTDGQAYWSEQWQPGYQSLMFRVEISSEPTASTSAASTFTYTGVTLNGTVNANYDSTDVTFEYGLTAGYGTTVTAEESPVSGGTDTSVSKAVTGLSPNTTYHYRVVGENDLGTAYGDDVTFDFVPATTYYMAKTTGDWSTLGTWKTSTTDSTDPNDFTTDATEAPTALNSNGIIINDNVAVTITSSISVDEVMIDAGASIIVNDGVILTVADGTGTDITAAGSIITNTTTGTLKIASGASVDANGAFTINGILTFDDGGANNGTLTIAHAAPTISSLEAGNGTITYDGTDQTIAAGITYNTVALSNTGTKTATGALTASTLTAGAGDYSVALNGDCSITNAVTFNNTGTLALGDASGDTLTFNGGIDTRPIPATHPSSTTLHGILKTSAAALAKVVLGTTTIIGDTTIDSVGNEVKFQAVTINDGKTLTVGTGDTGIIYFNSTINSEAGGTGHLTINTDSVVPLAENLGDIMPLGTITLIDGTVQLVSRNINAGTLLLNGGTFGLAASPSGTWDFDNVTIASGAIMNATSGSFTVSGNWNNSGTFNHKNGTVTFDSAGDSSITGSTTFYDFICTTAGKTLKFDSASGKSQTVSNWFTIYGTSGNNVIIEPNTASDAADINVTYADVQYATVSYSNNTGNTIFPANSTNSGNNTGWNFGLSGAFVWIGKTDSDWDKGTNWAGGSAPAQTTDNVIIAPGPNSLNINDDNRTVSNFTVESGVTVYVGSSKTLIVNGVLDNNGTLSIGTGTVSANGTFDATGGNVTFTGAGNLKLGGTAVTSMGTLSTDNGTVWYDYDGDLTILADTYNSLRISGSGTKTLGGAIVVNEDLTIDASATLDTGDGDNYGITLGGDWTCSGAFQARQGIVTLNGADQSLGGGNFYNLVLGGSGTKTLTGNIGIGAAFTVNSVTFDPTTNSKTVTYNGGDQTITALDYYGLAVSGTGVTKTFANGITKVAQEISLTDSMTLTGSSADNVTVQVTTPYNWDGSTGNGSATESRVFNVNANEKTVNISNMTIKGGDISPGTNQYGGSIYLSEGTLNISQCLITGSKADSGGGLQLAGSGALTIDESTVQYCTTTIPGGYGGGIRLGTNSYASLTLTNSTVDHNNADNYGGGISSGSDTTVAITNCTISDNTSNGNGGGVSSADVLNINFTTVANNHANNDDDGTQTGGGLFVNAGTPTVKNTILADNYLGSATTTGDDYYYNAGSLTDSGYNIVENQDGTSTGDGKTFTATSDFIYLGSGNDWAHGGGTVTGTLSLASTIADNGGPTQTLAITSQTGIAVGNGFYDAAVTTTDQRSASRHNPGPTIGAYEFYADYTTNGDGTSWSTAGNWNMYNGLTTNTATEAPNADNSTSITVAHDMSMGATLTIDQTTINAGKTLTVDMNGGTLTIADGSGTDLTVTGALVNADVNNNTITCQNNSTVIYNGGDQTLTGPAVYYNLEISGGGSSTKTLDGDLTVNGGLSVDANTTLAVDTQTLIVGGTSDINGSLTVSTGTVTANGTFDATGGSVAFTGSGTLTLGNTITSLGDTFTAGTGSVVFNYNGGTQIVSGSPVFHHVSINPGATFSPGSDITVNGNWDNGGTFTHNNHKVSFNGTSSGRMISSGSSGAFYDISFTGSGGQWTLLDDLIVNGIFEVTDGVFISGSHTVTLGASATYADGNITVANTTWTNGTLNIQSDAAMTLPDGETYNNLTLGRDAGTGNTLYGLLGSSPTINGTLTVEADARISLTPSALADNKIYDGTTAATVSLSDNHLSGFYEDYELHYTSALFDSADVGTNINVNVSGISISGTDAGRYQLSSTTAASSADILQSVASAGSVRLPVTGQTTSYKSNDDGDLERGLTWPVPRFTNNGDGTITDNLTGLIWLRKADLLNTYGNATWSEAIDFVKEINSTGKVAVGTGAETDAGDTSNGGTHQTDWRLPNRNEFESIMTLEPDSGAANISQWLNAQGFQGVSETTRYWTSTTYAGDSDDAWHAQLYEGRIRHWVKDTAGPLMVVRGEGTGAPAPVWKTGQTETYGDGDDGDLEKGSAWPDPRFTDNGDGTVTDNLTDLVWLKKTNTAGAQVNWTTAFTYIDELNASGTMNALDAGDTSNGGTHQTDWRLPNRKELFSLLDQSQLNPAVKSGHPFSDIESEWYWTSSTDDLNTANAWAISMGSGSVSRGPRTDTRYVWAVRQAYYRSKQTGNWSDTATWEKSCDGLAWENAGSVPGSSHAGITIKSGHTVTVDGDVTIDQTSIENGATLDVNDGVTLTVADGGGTDMDVNGELLLTGSAVVDCNGEFDATGGNVTFGGSGTLNLGSTITSLGTFSCGTGTVIIDGASQSLPYGYTFYNLSKNVASVDTLIFKAGSTTTVTGTLTLQGASGALLSLRSSSDGTQWNIDPQGNRTIAYLDVKDSSNTNATAIDTEGTNSTDSGNNTNWTFNQLPVVTTQAVTGIGTSSATGHGTITDLGTANPTAYGVCWSTTLNPTTADANINNGATGSTGAFTADLTGLSAGTTYHVRAYATSTAGTSYGEDVSFTTTSPLPSPAWYTVTFNLDGKGTRTGGGALVQSIKGGSSASAPLVQANSGYSFTGWDQSFSNVQASMTVTAQYTTQTFTLSYTAGTGGTITGTSPQIVNRGASGSPVTASPLAGYRFTGWSDGSKANPRTDTNVTSNISVKASFGLLTYKLTVQAGTGDGAYAPGTVVSITADPASEGMIFDKWTGQTANVANLNLADTSLTIPESDVTVTAVYKEKPLENFILTVTDGNGDGSYEAGTIVSISADPAPEGMIFDKWTGQTANVANLNLADTSLTIPESDVTVTAVYKEKPLENFILTVTDGNGDGSYEAGTVISISASPAPDGMIFDKWTGQTANIANLNLANTSLTMPESDVTVTAAYKEKSMEKFMLAVTDGTGDGSYEAGEVVSISAGIAPKGMIFDKWTGQTATIANTNLANTSLTMPESDVTVTATYRQKPVEKFSLVVDSGTGDGEYKAGRIVTIAATPAEDGLIFHRWTGQTSNVSNVNIPNTTITMPGRSVRVRAVYKADPGASFVLQIRIQTQGDGVGTTLRSSTKTLRNGEERDETIPAGQLVVLTAPDPPEGYMFDKWTGQTEYITNINLPETTMYMPDADVVVIATYRPLQAEVDLSVLDGSGSGIYAPETIVPIMADPAPDGEMFDKWMGQTANVVNINLPETSLIMPGVDVAVQAVYCEMPGEIFELTVVNGSGSGSYPAASLVEVTADPAPEGYMFDKWMGQNATVDDIFNPETFVFMPPNEAMIIATYALSGDEPDDPDEPDENDTDQDGVLDAWEIANYGDILLDAEDYDAMDTDGDGYTDLEEYQRGTDIRILDNLVTGYLVLLNDAGYTLSDGSRTKVYGNDSANYLMLETGAAAECISFPGENTFILPSEAWLFTVSRSGAAVTLKGQDHTRLVLPATTTKQTIAFSDGAAALKIEDGSVFLGDQLITTSPSPVVTTLEALPEITEHPSGDIENPDAYLLLTGEKPYTIRKGTTTEVYGNADMNMLLLEGGAAARLYSFSNTNTFSIGAASTLFTVSRSGTTVTISGSDGTLLIVGATLNAQQISFTDITLEMLIESEKVILGEQVVEIEPLPVE